MDVHLHQGHLWHAVSGGAVPPGEQLLLAANGSVSRPVLAVEGRGYPMTCSQPHRPRHGSACGLGSQPGSMSKLYMIAFASTVRFCRVADLDWRLSRVYFLAFLNPSRGQPVPALTARLASLCHRRSANDGARP